MQENENKKDLQELINAVFIISLLMAFFSPYLTAIGVAISAIAYTLLL